MPRKPRSSFRTGSPGAKSRPNNQNVNSGRMDLAFAVALYIRAVSDGYSTKPGNPGKGKTSALEHVINQLANSDRGHFISKKVLRDHLKKCEITLGENDSGVLIKSPSIYKPALVVPIRDE